MHAGPAMRWWLLALPIALTVAGSGDLAAQRTSKSTQGFTTVRRLQLSEDSAQAEIVVAEFFGHGELDDEGMNLAVTTAQDSPVPWRVLQAGPGDFLRVAFQTLPKKSIYKIHYGGTGSTWKSPAWSSKAGLFMETRRWKPCDMQQLASVRAAFQSAQPLGGNYVANVFHGYNPFWPEPEPFLTHYRGTLEIPREGQYQFFTSSQDCSFLLIDGKMVVSAPGAHGPVRDARIKGLANLDAGSHSFEYVHAASGGLACMAAAWQPPGAKQPEIIPPRVLGSRKVVHVVPGRPQHVTRGLLPDFTFDILGEAPLADVDLPLIRAQFKASSGTTAFAKYHWNFGDGQEASDANPGHIYLHSGLFTVTLKSKVGGKQQESANRIRIFRGLDIVRQGKEPDQLSDYLPALTRYNPMVLDPLSALQLIRFSEQIRQVDRAGKIGKSWLLGKPLPQDESIVFEMARTVAPLLRDRQDDSAGALAIWEAGVRGTRRPAWKAQCELEAAEIFLSDLHQRTGAKNLLQAAEPRLARLGDTTLSSRLQRLWGDYHARGGDGKSARAAYSRAEKARGSRTGTAEREARRGAHSRSTESFLREKSLSRARDELRLWQDEFPLDKIDGYLSLLQARYYFEKGRFPHAIVTANDLLAVNPESPYADRALFLAGESEEKQGQPDRARVLYQAIVTDYPGSPLVTAARQKLGKAADSKKDQRPALKRGGP